MRYLIAAALCLLPALAFADDAPPVTVDGSTITFNGSHQLQSSGGACTNNCTFTGTLATGTLTATTFEGWSPQLYAQDNSAGAPSAAGSGYVTGDRVTLSGGSVVVVTASAGAVTGFYLAAPATVTRVPSQPETQASTSGSGTGATFTITYGVWSPILTQPGTSNAGINGWTRLGYNACSQYYSSSPTPLAPTCLGNRVGGAGGNDDIGFGGGTGMSGGQESTFVGNLPGAQVTTGYWLTCTGHNACGHETTGYQSEYYGVDSGKYALSSHLVSAYGTNTSKFIWNGNQNVTIGGNTMVGGLFQPTISAAASGTGSVYRLTVSSSTGMTTGDAVFIHGVGGTAAINTTGTPYYITVVDGTHIELQGTTYASGLTFSNSPFVSDMPGGFINVAIGGTQSNGGAVQILVNNTVNIPTTGSGLYVGGVTGTTEANGTWSYTVNNVSCISATPTCGITLTGSTYVNAYVSGGHATSLTGVNNVMAVGYSSLTGTGLTGSTTGCTFLGNTQAINLKGCLNSTLVGNGVGNATFGSTSSNFGVILIGVDTSTDVAGTSVNNAICIGQNIKCGSGAVAIGYRAGFSNNITSSAQNYVLVGSQTGFSMTAPNAVTAVGQQVGHSTCTSPTKVLLLGVDNNTDCTSATESNVIHMGAGASDVLYVTGTTAPSTSKAMFAGGLQIGSTTGLNIANGDLAFAKITASGSAPGAAGGKMELVCGTNAGTAKLIAYAGTSGTAVTITDNIGAGVTGC